MDQIELDNLQRLKKAFAAELIKSPREPFRAAARIFSNPRTAYDCSLHWPNDPEVMRYKRELINDIKGPDALLPTRFELAYKMLNMAEEVNEFGMYTLEGRDRISAIKLTAELLQYLGKAAEEAIQHNNYGVKNLTIQFVNPQENNGDNARVIDMAASVDSEPQNIVDALPIALSFVGTAD